MSTAINGQGSAGYVRVVEQIAQALVDHLGAGLDAQGRFGQGFGAILRLIIGVEQHQGRGNAVDLDVRGVTGGKRQGQVVQAGLAGAVGQMLAAAFAGHVVADMDDVGRRRAPQQFGAVQVDQVGREHVHVEQLLEHRRFLPWRFAQPLRGVVDDGAQAVGVPMQGFYKGHDPGFAGEVGVQCHCAALAQFKQARTFTAVADNHSVTIIEQAQCTVQTYALAGSSKQNRCG